MSPQSRVHALYFLFALSGFCGLIYESIWSHYLKLFVGHAAYAQTLVLTVFMGGMGIGAWVTARYTRRLRNLLWCYAAAELLIGISALTFHSAFGWLTEWAYTSLLPATCSEEGACVAQWMLAAAMILPQSILLGTTFPLMTGGVLRLAPASPGRQLALLYFLNSIGAAFGVLASGFILIPALGLPGTMMTAGIGNLLLAIAVYFVAKPRAADAAKPAVALGSTPTPVQTGVPWLGTLLLISLLTGLSSFIYEVVWIRMLSMVLGSATHSFEIMLASFILGLALGGAWIRKRIDRIDEVLVYLAVVQLAMGVLALATLPLYNYTFDAMGWLFLGLQRSDAGYVLFTVALQLIALSVMLPAAFCAGMTLPLITYRLYQGSSGERAIGQVYAANTVGAILGVLLTVHWLMPTIGLKYSLVVAAGIDIALGLWLLQRRYRVMQRLRPGVRIAAAGAIVFAAVSVFTFEFDPLRMGSGVFLGGTSRLNASAEVLYVGDGKTATVQITRFTDGSVALSTNGKGDGSIQMTPGNTTIGDEATMALLGALPLAYRPDAAEVAVIGFGTGMSSTTLLGSLNLKHLDTIEIEPNIVLAAQHFRPLVDLAFTDPRHRIVIEDAKAFLARGQRRYDIIVSEPSNPWVSGVSSLFTQEFYSRIRKHLKPEGLLVQWIHVYEITPQLVASIFRSMSASFPVYEVWMGSLGDMIVIASPDGALPVVDDQLYAMPAVKAMLDRVGLPTPQHLALQRVGDQQLMTPLMRSFGASPNSDYFPIVDLNGPHARFLGADAMALTTLHQTLAPLMLALQGRPALGYVGDAPAQRDLSSRHAPYLRARQLVAYVQGGVLPTAEQSYIADYDTAAVARSRLFTCEGLTLQAASWDGVVRIAAETIPFLAQADALAFWNATRESTCAPALEPWQRRWLDLFVTLAASRWEEAAALVTLMLEETNGGSDAPQNPPPTLTVFQRLYLTQAGAGALIASGHGAAANDLIISQANILRSALGGEAWVRLALSQTQQAAR